MPSLEAAQPLTHVEALELDYLPPHLIVLDGGYVGLELAQAYRRSTDETQGFMKALVSAGDHRILNFTMLGADAGEVVAAVQTAMLVNPPYSRLCARFLPIRRWLKDSVRSSPTCPL